MSRADPDISDEEILIRRLYSCRDYIALFDCNVNEQKSSTARTATDANRVSRRV